MTVFGQGGLKPQQEAQAVARTLSPIPFPHLNHRIWQAGLSFGRGKRRRWPRSSNWTWIFSALNDQIKGHFVLEWFFSTHRHTHHTDRFTLTCIIKPVGKTATANVNSSHSTTKQGRFYGRGRRATSHSFSHRSGPIGSQTKFFWSVIGYLGWKFSDYRVVQKKRGHSTFSQISRKLLKISKWFFAHIKASVCLTCL